MLPILVFQLTGSALQFATLVAVEVLPYLVFGLPAGATADRINRRVLMVGGDLLNAGLLASIPSRPPSGSSRWRRSTWWRCSPPRPSGIAQALLGDPRLLIVDEPTVGLDPEERIRFRTLLAQLDGQRTVLLSTHIVEDVSATCRDVAVLARGRVVFTGTVEDLVAVADGHVWTVDDPRGDVTVVSVAHDRSGPRYRVVGRPASGVAADRTLPGLEDGYLWLMQQHRVPAEDAPAPAGARSDAGG